MDSQRIAVRRCLICVGLVLTVAAATYVVSEAQIARHRVELREHCEEQGASLLPPCCLWAQPGMGWPDNTTRLRRFFGDTEIQIIQFPRMISESDR